MIDYPPPPLDHVKRLVIMLLLDREDSFEFSELYRIMGISKGALDSHLKMLEKYEFTYRERNLMDGAGRVRVRATIEGLNALKSVKSIWSEILGV